MKIDQVLATLETAAEELQIKVRYEGLGTAGIHGGGGLCRVRGALHLILDKKAPPAERVALLMDALATFDTDGLELPPKVRSGIEARRRGPQVDVISSGGAETSGAPTEG
jgi:hypothetical protein